MGNKVNTATTTTKPPADVLAQYQSLLQRASGVSNGQTVAPLNSTQNQAIGSFNQIPSQFLPQAQNYVQQGASPITGGQIANYSNPFQQSVVNATMGNINETNAEQQQQVTGNAIAQGALGGNRVGVAQGELARQQGLANNQTLAGLNAGNYQQALGAAQQDRAASAAAAGAEGGLQTQALQGATAQLGAGTVQQQQAAAQLQQPYQQASWLASLEGGIGPLQGQTQTQTTPGPNIGSQILGGGLALAGGFMGLERGGRIPGYAAGGGPGGELGGLEMTLPMYSPIATAQPMALPSQNQNQGNQGASTLNQGFGDFGAGLSKLLSKSPDLTGGMGLGMGQLYRKGGAVHRADGGPIQPQSDVHRMVSSAIDIAKTMKGGLGGVTGLSSSGGAVMPDPQGIYVPRGYDDGGMVTPNFQDSFQNDATLTPAQALAAAYYAPIAKAITPSTGAPAGLGATPAGASGAPMQLGRPQAPAPPPQPQAPTPQPQSAPAAGGVNAPPMGGPTNDPSMAGADPNSLNGLMAGIGQQKQGRKAFAMPLMAAGLGMMASQSPFLGTAIGQGGLEAMNYLQQQRNYDRQIAIAVSQNAYRQQRADIADRNADTASRRADISAGTLDRMAKNEQDRAAAESATAARLANAPESPQGKLAQDHARGLVSDADYAAAKSALPNGGSAASNLPTVPIDQQGRPDPGAQQQFLAALPTGTAALVKSVGDYRADPAKVTSMRGNNRQQFMELVSQYDPTFSMAQYPVRQAMMKSITSGDYSKAVNSANLVIQHIDAMEQSAQGLGNGNFPAINTVRNAVKQQTGDPSITAFNTSADAVASEAAKVFKGTGASDVQSINDWRSNLSVNSSPAQIQAAGKMLVGNLLASRLNTIKTQYESAMGKPADFRFLTPHSRQVLQKYGIDPSDLDTSAPETTSAATPNGGTGTTAASSVDPVEAEMRRRGLLQ